MYVCLCNGITERAVRAAADAGARDLADLRAMTGCASTCGSCADVALQVLHEARRRLSPPAIVVPDRPPRCGRFSLPHRQRDFARLTLEFVSEPTP
jgi:bacterioferritin-associated ferredoxin